MIIDFHTHTFPDRIASKAMYQLSHQIEIYPEFDGTYLGLVENMKKNSIDYSVVQPIATNPKQVESINNNSILLNKSFKETHVLYFGSIHPDYIDYKNELKRIKENGIIGIKLHPVYQKTNANSINMINIINEAFKNGLIVLIHAGLDPGFPLDFYSCFDNILDMINKVDLDKGTLILAHMGSFSEWDKVLSKLCGKNVYFDTAMSYSYGNTFDKPLAELMDDELFLKIINKHGYLKILFGTDNPWMPPKRMVEHLKNLNLEKDVIDSILYKNALKLLKLDED